MADTTQRPRLGIGKRIVFATIPLVILLLVAELTVRVFHLADSCPNEYTNSALWACDPILDVKLNPNVAPNGKPLNTAGFRTHEFTRKRPGIYRVLSLGDSCTFGVLATDHFGYVSEPYPQALERLVVEAQRAR